MIDNNYKELSKIEEYKPKNELEETPAVIGLNEQKLYVKRSIIFDDGTSGQVWTVDINDPSKGSWQDIPATPAKKYCTASYGGTQSFTNTWTQITVGAINSEYDTNDNSMRDTTNKRINITKSGRYLIIGTVDCINNAGTATDHGIAIYINGVPQKQIYEQSNVYPIDRFMFQVSHIQSLSVGDYIELYAYNANQSVGTSNTQLQAQEL